jgi:dihydroxyacid dehydratase/phosphogluconate dehydratase
MMAAIMADKINHGDVMVLRYEGPGKQMGSDTT